MEKKRQRYMSHEVQNELIAVQIQRKIATDLRVYISDDWWM